MKFSLAHERIFFTAKLVRVNCFKFYSIPYFLFFYNIKQKRCMSFTENEENNVTSTATNYWKQVCSSLMLDYYSIGIYLTFFSLLYYLLFWFVVFFTFLIRLPFFGDCHSYVWNLVCYWSENHFSYICYIWLKLKYIHFYFVGLFLLSILEMKKYINLF